MIQLGKTVKTIHFDDIPGGPQQVWGGWIWCRPGGIEYPWTKRADRRDCEAVVLEACYRLGINNALDIDR